MTQQAFQNISGRPWSGLCASPKPAQVRSHQIAIAIKPALSFSTGFLISHTIHSRDVQTARHHLQADRSERNDQEWSQDYNQQDFHRVTFEAPAPLSDRPELPAPTVELQPQRLFELGNVRESRNCRPIRNDADADNDSKSNQQCETRWPAMMLVLIDIRHDIDLPQGIVTGALRRSRRAASTRRL